MTDRERDKDAQGGRRVVDGMMTANEEVMKRAGSKMLKAAPKAARLVLKSMPGIPGLALTAFDILTAKDRARAMAGAAGGAVGGIAGGAIGLATGPGAPIAVPAAAAAGMVGGQEIGEDIYDELSGRREADRRAATKAWIARRNEDLAQRSR